MERQGFLQTLEQPLWFVLDKQSMRHVDSGMFFDEAVDLREEVSQLLEGKPHSNRFEVRQGLVKITGRAGI